MVVRTNVGTRPTASRAHGRPPPENDQSAVFRLQNLLLEHHGRVDDLILCKGSFTEANELKDEMQTLKGYGIKGAPRGIEPPVTVQLFYDFKPVAYDEPLLFLWQNFTQCCLQSTTAQPRSSTSTTSDSVYSVTPRGSESQQ